MVGRDFATFFCRRDKRLLRGRERERREGAENRAKMNRPSSIIATSNLAEILGKIFKCSIRDYHHDTAIDFQRALERPIGVGDESPINVA